MERNPQTDLVHLGERVDDLQNGFYVIQNPEKFCFGMDAVLLSGFAKIRNNARVLDMGTVQELFRSCLRAGRREHILQDLRYKKNVQIWRHAVLRIMDWNLQLILYAETSKRLLKFLEQLLLM